MVSAAPQSAQKGARDWDRIGDAVILVILFVISFSFAGYYLLPRALPWWTDTGEWVMYAHGDWGSILSAFGLASPSAREVLLGPMLNINPWQYPPLFSLLQIGFASFLGDIMAMKFLGVLLFAAQPIPIFLLAKKITKQTAPAFFAGLAQSLSPIQAEMLGWGGYPNLLGLFLMEMAFLFALDWVEKDRSRYFAAAAASGSLAVLAHQLTSGILFGVSALWLVFTVLVNRYPKHNLHAGKVDPIFSWRKLVSLMAVWGVVFVAYRLAIWPSQYITGNSAALYSLTVNLGTVVPYVFKGMIPMILIPVIIGAGLLELRKWFDIRYLMLIDAWSIFPLAATQGYLLGVYLDYNRILFFVVQPLYLLIALPLAVALTMKAPTFGTRYMANLIDYFTGLKINPVKMGALFLAFLTVTSSLSLFQLGWNTVGNVNTWYNGPIDPYGSQPKLAALNWIRSSTPVNSTFVADEQIGRWIEGYGERPVYLYDQPQFLFLQGERARSLVAADILFANSIVQDCYARVYDQAPYGSATPSVGVWLDGEFADVLSVDGVASTVSVSGANVPVFNGSLAQGGSTTYGGDGFSASYAMGLVRVNEGVSLDGNVLDANYTVSGPGVSGLTLLLSTDASGDVTGVQVAGGVASVGTGSGVVQVESDGNATLFGGGGVAFSFRGDGSRVSASLKMTFSTPQSPGGGCGTQVTSRSSLMSQNGIEYVVVPRVQTAEPGLQTLPQYEHLLLDPALLVAYSNENVIILQAKGE